MKNKNILGLIFFGTIGFIAGIFAAKKPGKETLKDVQHKVEEVSKNVTAKIEDKVNEIENSSEPQPVEKLKQEIKDLIDKTESKIDKKL